MTNGKVVFFRPANVTAVSIGHEVGGIVRATIEVYLPKGFDLDHCLVPVIAGHIIEGDFKSGPHILKQKDDKA